MLANEREKKIRQLLLEYKHIDIHTLCSLLSCSIATARRDLDKLEKAGFLIKAYGGAVLKETASQDIVISGMEDAYLNEKIQIGVIASALIDENDVIFLAAGSTCMQIAKNLDRKKELTVVTTSVNITNELLGEPHINLISTGGNIQSLGNDSYCSGSIAQASASGMFFQKCFFSVDAASIEFGYMLNNDKDYALLKTVMEHSEDTYVVLDYSKFNKRAFSSFCSILDIKKIITNTYLPDEYKKYLFSNGIKLYTTFDNI